MYNLYMYRCRYITTSSWFWTIFGGLYSADQGGRCEGGARRLCVGGAVRTSLGSSEYQNATAVGGDGSGWGWFVVKIILFQNQCATALRGRWLTIDSAKCFMFMVYQSSHTCSSHRPLPDFHPRPQIFATAGIHLHMIGFSRAPTETIGNVTFLYWNWRVHISTVRIFLLIVSSWKFRMSQGYQSVGFPEIFAVQLQPHPGVLESHRLVDLKFKIARKSQNHNFSLKSQYTIFEKSKISPRYFFIFWKLLY